VTFWTEAWELLTAGDAGLAETAAYHADADAPARVFQGVFDELPGPEIQDDLSGRGERRRGLLQLPLEDAQGPVQVAVDGRAWFVLRGVRWTIDRVLQERGAWHVFLTAVLDQSVRRAQRSTRSP
jgi:hypothetical protein